LNSRSKKSGGHGTLTEADARWLPLKLLVPARKTRTSQKMSTAKSWA
jgi:hypothetical protein